MTEKTWTRRRGRFNSVFTIGVLLLFTGCTGQRQKVAFADLGVWDDSVKQLGPVSACQGGFCCPDGACQWPLSLTIPPPVETYHRALVDDAMKRYGVPANEVVLYGVTVELITEIVGTIRGWSAVAFAGSKPVVAAHPAPAPATSEERLENLEKLHKKGLLTDEEYTQKRAVILNEL